MTLPRMLVVALALLVPVVGVSVFLADALAPVLDSRSLLAQTLAFTGYALSGGCAGFIFGRRTGGDDPPGTAYAERRQRERRSFNRKFALLIVILVVPLFMLNLLLSPNKAEFLRWEAAVFSFMGVAGVVGFAMRRFSDSRHQAD